MRLLTILRLLIAGALFLSLTACDSNDENDSSSLDGVYQLRSDDGDIFFISIEGRSVTSYDYFGDSFDQGDDCYGTFTETGSRSGEVLTFRTVEDGIEYRLEVTVEDDVLTFADYEDGQLFASDKWDRSDRRISSFTPICGSDKRKLSDKR